MWISKKLKMLNVWGIYLKYRDSQTNKQNTIILTYKELHGTCIKSKKQHIYSIFQISQQKFSKLNVSPHQVCRKFDPFYRQPPIWSFPPWCIFTNSPIFTTFFWQYRPNDIEVNTEIKSWGKVISSCLEDYKTTLHYFFISNTFMCHTNRRFHSN